MKKSLFIPSNDFEKTEYTPTGVDEGGDSPLKQLSHPVIIGLILFLLIASVSSAAASGTGDEPEALIIRADRIESAGLLMGLDSGQRSWLLTLQIGESKIEGMEMAASYGNGQGGWQLDIQDSGPVSIQDLQVKVSAIGFKIKPGDLLEIDRPVPSVVLHDVYLRVEKMEAGSAHMPSLDLDTTKEVSLERPQGGIFIDLRQFGEDDEQEVEKEVNRMVSGEPEEEKKEKEAPTDGDQSADEHKQDENSGEGDTEDPDSAQEGDSDPDEGADQQEELTKTIRLKRYFSALEIVNQAKTYDADITLKRKDKEYDAKDWGRMVLMKRFSGTEIELVVNGPDQMKALKEMAQFLGKEE